MRDRLIELLEATGMVENRARCSIIADELIAQGVVLPAPMDANGRIHKDFFAILRDDSYGICPAPTSDRLAIQTLCDYLLCEECGARMKGDKTDD